MSLKCLVWQDANPFEGHSLGDPQGRSLDAAWAAMRGLGFEGRRCGDTHGALRVAVTCAVPPPSMADLGAHGEAWGDLRVAGGGSGITPPYPCQKNTALNGHDAFGSFSTRGEGG